MTDYDTFLQGKVSAHIDSGFDIAESELHESLFDFQKFIVRRALQRGRYAIFADCGLGKTFMQLEWANQITKRTGKPVLILCPLAVAGQTIAEGERFGIEVKRYDGTSPIQITNYEQLDNIDVSQFVGVVLDESSILKNFTGVYKNKIIDAFIVTPYKLACTATPAPNDLNEIGNHSQFLGVMDSTDMRMRWFIRDNDMNNYRLKGHAETEFYGWIAEWASVLRTPADLGFAIADFKLPALNYHERTVVASLKDNGKLFNDAHVNATSFNGELRLTLLPRIECVAEIVNSSEDPFIVWVNQNLEEDAVLKAVPDAVAVRGNEVSTVKERKLLGFAAGDFRVLVTKKKIAQFGLNYQHCNNQVFAALDFSFEGLYQAIRRSYRFGQKREVNIYLITTDTMSNVLKSIHAKQKLFDSMMTKITESVNANIYGLKMNYDKLETVTDDYTLRCGDSCELIKEIPSDSIDFSVFSPPFSNLFTYSDSIRDMGNSEDDAQFFQHTDYLLSELYRVIRPGRLVAVHSKDIARYKNSSGYSGMYDFTGDYHRAMERAGFRYHSKITIWIDPVLEMQRTKTQRLLYKQLRTDSSYTGIGMPEYITLFRKWSGDEDSWTPIVNKTKDNFPLDTWQKWASPIWAIDNVDKDMEMCVPLLSEDALSELPDAVIKRYANPCWYDIQRTNVLNGYKGAREERDERHICPMQLDVIERCVILWSNPGEVVFTPFAGVGSEVYQAVKLGRKGIGFELKPSYYELAKRNLNNAIISRSQMRLL